MPTLPHPTMHIPIDSAQALSGIQAKLIVRNVSNKQFEVYTQNGQLKYIASDDVFTGVFAKAYGKIPVIMEGGGATVCLGVEPGANELPPGFSNWVKIGPKSWAAVEPEELVPVPGYREADPLARPEVAANYARTMFR